MDTNLALSLISLLLSLTSLIILFFLLKRDNKLKKLEKEYTEIDIDSPSAGTDVLGFLFLSQKHFKELSFRCKLSLVGFYIFLILFIVLPFVSLQLP